METNKILQSDYLDLIFDNRNKNYGGYELRKHYNSRALRALGITFSILLLGVTTPFLWSKLNAKDNLISAPVPINDLQLTNVYMPPPPAPPDAPKPPEPVNAAPPPAEKTVVFAAPEIVPPNINPPEPPPDMKELEHAVVGAVANPGEDGHVAATTGDKHVGPFGNGRGGTELKGGSSGETGNKEAVTFAEVMPEYPGGMSALLAFIQRNLKYPPMAAEEGIEGRVIVTFIVNTKGEIENAKVIKSIGGGCDKEALRVVNAMPKWKAGKQNGQPVKVYYTLPISFKLQK